MDEDGWQYAADWDGPWGNERTSGTCVCPPRVIHPIDCLCPLLLLVLGDKVRRRRHILTVAYIGPKDKCVVRSQYCRFSLLLLLSLSFRLVCRSGLVPSRRRRSFALLVALALYDFRCSVGSVFKMKEEARERKVRNSLRS